VTVDAIEVTPVGEGDANAGDLATEVVREHTLPFWLRDIKAGGGTRSVR
jgi:hypothetical protein